MDYGCRNVVNEGQKANCRVVAGEAERERASLMVKSLEISSRAYSENSAVLEELNSPETSFVSW